MNAEMIDRTTLTMLSSELLKQIKAQLEEETKKVIKDIDSILSERGEE